MEMKECWVSIKGYKGIYEVSNFGRVRSLDRYVEGKDGSRRKIKGRMINPTLDRAGYPKVHLSVDNKKTMYRVHKLVAEHFIEKPLEGKWFVNRKDGDRTNNKVDNLYWEKDSVSNSNAGKIGGKVSKREQ